MTEIVFAKIDENGDFDILHELIEIEASWNENTSQDENIGFDEDLSWDENNDALLMLNTLFDTHNDWADIEHFHLREDCHLYAKDFVEDVEINGVAAVGKNGQFIVKGEIREESL